MLRDLYYNLKNPSSFKGVETIFNVAKLINKSIKRKEVKAWLHRRKPYTTHLPIKINFKRNPIVSKTINHIWMADLMEVKHFKENDNYKYILVIVDNLSKKTYCEPIKNKKAETVKKAFLKIFNESGTKPMILVTDAGAEFTNPSLKRYIKWRKIKHQTVRDRTKAWNAERMIRTIKELIEEYTDSRNSKRFIDDFQQFISNINNSIHSRTKFKPNDVNTDNEREVFRNLYKMRTAGEKAKYKIGDRVRVVLARGKFDKGHEKNYSDEIFKIHKIYQLFPYFKYRLRDKEGVLIRGSYYSKEIVKVHHGEEVLS